MEPKVSVIVPVYKTEKYLEKCLESLVKQTLEDIEIIVVNDESPDNSQDIIDKYVENYPTKIISLKKKNGGLSDSRNFGLEYAKAKYVSFVDSDDWVDLKMFETLYEVAKEGHDIVICDCIVVMDGYETGHTARGFRGPSFDKRNAVIYSTDPAIVCSKLFNRHLFKMIKFPKHWYEDIATTPILMSYSNSIEYVGIPFYYYRQRNDSITSSYDERTLGVINSWKRVFEQVNPQFINEAVFAVCRSISTFIEFKSKYADKFIEFVHQNQNIIGKNTLYQESVRNGKIKDLFNLELIPKKIHYCWFGNGKKTELAERCIQNWKERLPDYEIIEWNETNCDINENSYVKEAYKARKWAFVADYFRLKAIYEQGGIYLDTDTEITGELDLLRINKAFFAFETAQFVHAGIFGAVKQLKLIKEWLDTYKNDKFFRKDGSLNTKTIVVRLTDILVNKYNIRLNGKQQTLENNITIYPANILTIDVFDGKSCAVHHYDSSWWDVKTGPSYKQVVLKEYFKEMFIENGEIINSSEPGITDKYQKRIYELENLILAYENTFSWKITKPVRALGRFMKKIKGNKK